MLILSLLLPAAGSIAYLHLQRVMVKKAIKKKLLNDIPLEGLTVFSLNKEGSKHQLKWEDDQEFEYNGEMYDVVYTKIKGDSISYWCWRDMEETIINRKLEQTVALLISKNPENNNLQHWLNHFYKSLYFCQISNFHLYFTSEEKNTFFENTTFIQKYKIPPSPPPKLT